MAADIEQMEAVIAQFMDYARGDGGETEAAVDLNRLLGEIAAASALGHPVAADLPPLPRWSGGSGRYAGPSQSRRQRLQVRRPPVELKAAVAVDAVTIEILDRGPGVPRLKPIG